MNPRAALACALLIAAASVVLSLAYASVTPYRQPGALFSVLQRGQPIPIPDIGAPDENRHANYVAALMERRELPVLRAGAPDFDDTYQSHQPPLYYIAAAVWASALGVDPRQPSAALPMRALSALFGALTVVAVFYASRWGIRRDEVALGAAAIAGFLPMLAALNGAVSNDPLLFALMSWALAGLAGCMRAGWPLKATIVTGLAIGLAWLTKTSALALLPTAVVALWVSRAGWRKWLGLLGVAALVAAPWWIRNALVYGDPLALQAFNVAFGGQANAAAFMDSYGYVGYWRDWVLRHALQSMVGMFGYMDIPLPEAIYRTAFVVGGVGVIGWALAMMRLRDEASDQEERSKLARFHIVCTALLLTVVALFVQFNLTYYQAQARYLFPALAPIAIGLSIGWAKAFGRWGHFAWAAIAVLLLTLDAVAISMLPTAFKERAAYSQSSGG